MNYELKIMNYINSLLQFLDNSPVNFLAVETISQQLKEAGFEHLDACDKLGEMKKLIQCFENIELWWNRLCSLWTAYCFQNSMTPDSENYSLDLREVWAEMPENVRGDFEDFDSFMSRYLG